MLQENFHWPFHIHDKWILMNAGYSHLNELVYFLQSCHLDIHCNSYSSRNEILCSEKKFFCSEMKLRDIRRKWSLPVLHSVQKVWYLLTKWWCLNSLLHPSNKYTGVCILHTIFALEMCTISEWFKLRQYSFHGSKVSAVCAIIFL